MDLLERIAMADVDEVPPLPPDLPEKTIPDAIGEKISVALCVVGEDYMVDDESGHAPYRMKFSEVHRGKYKFCGSTGDFVNLDATDTVFRASVQAPPPPPEAKREIENPDLRRLAAEHEARVAESAKPKPAAEPAAAVRGGNCPGSGLAPSLMNHKVITCRVCGAERPTPKPALGDEFPINVKFPGHRPAKIDTIPPTPVPTPPPEYFQGVRQGKTVALKPGECASYSGMVADSSQGKTAALRLWECASYSGMVADSSTRSASVIDTSAPTTEAPSTTLPDQDMDQPHHGHDEDDVDDMGDPATIHAALEAVGSKMGTESVGTHPPAPDAKSAFSGESFGKGISWPTALLTPEMRQQLGEIPPLPPPETAAEEVRRLCVEAGLGVEGEARVCIRMMTDLHMAPEDAVKEIVAEFSGVATEHAPAATSVAQNIQINADIRVDGEVVTRDEIAILSALFSDKARAIPRAALSDLTLGLLRRLELVD